MMTMLWLLFSFWMDIFDCKTTDMTHSLKYTCKNKIGTHDDRYGPVFPNCQIRCHGNKLILRENTESRLISPAFFALPFHNELQYHYLDACINRGGDDTKSCKNLVKFCLLMPQMTGLICIPMYSHLHTFLCRAAVQKCHGVLERWWAC